MVGGLHSKGLKGDDSEHSTWVAPQVNDFVEFAMSEQAFSALAGELEHQLDTAARLPDWPFRAPVGFVTIFEYDRLLGGMFGAVLESLAHTYEDESVAVLGLDPAVAYYRERFGVFPGFRITRESLGAGYAAGLFHEPGDDPAGALIYSIDVLGIVGSSGAWAVWGERDWEIALLLTTHSEGPWLHQSVPWFGRDVELDALRSPSGWGRPLGPSELSRFQMHVRMRGSGP